MDAEFAYLFRHALLRDAAYQVQMPGDRARLHALAFECMEASPLRTAAWAAELAEHARLAQDCLPDGAACELRYLAQGAEFAQSRYRHEETVNLALRLARHHSATRAQKQNGYQLALNASLYSGRADRVVALAQEARPLQLGGEFAPFAAHMEGQALCMLARYEEAARGLEAHLSQPAPPSRSLAGCRFALSRAQEYLGHLAKSEANLEALLELEKTRPELVNGAAVRLALAEILKHIGHAPRAIEILNELVAQAGQSPNVAALARSNLANTLRVYTADASRAEQLYREAIEIARGHFLPVALGNALGNYGQMLVEKGRTQEALVMLNDALAMAREHAMRREESYWLGGLGLLYASVRDFEKARGFFNQARALARSIRYPSGEQNWTTELAKLLLEFGHRREARVHYIIARRLAARISNKKAQEAYTRQIERIGRVPRAPRG